ncbi:hypothetical protein [Streptosporangium saharense]|uniref:hypothetical protein n=1 Tax=Streptosporangium saharense TaxID=1706840 RepID=UPI00342F5065
MRQLRHGAPFGWLLSLLFPLLVAAGPAALPSSPAASFTPFGTRTAATPATRPLSRESRESRDTSAGERPHAPGTLASALLSALSGPAAAGGHPAVAPRTGFAPLLPPAGSHSRSAGEVLLAPPASGTGPARAPPFSTGV